MAYSMTAVEIVSSIIALLSIIFNLIAIYTISQLRKDASLSVGLGLILIVATYDLAGPFVGIIQEIIIKARDDHVLKYSTPCQILGVIQTLVPFISTGAVALLSLERYLYIYQILIPKYKTIMILALHFSLGLILAVLAATKGDFTMASSRMICMPTPYDGIFGQIWYYSLIFFLFLHSIIIIFCYAKIISLRRILTEKIAIPIQMSTRNHYIGGSITSITSNSSHFGNPTNFIANHFNEIRNSASLEKNRPQSVSTKASTKYKWYKPDRFVIKAVTLMLAYLVCIVPGLIVMIHHAIQSHVKGSNQPMIPELSALLFLPLFSISLINPILLLSLHNKASDKFKENWGHFLNKLRLKT